MFQPKVKISQAFAGLLCLLLPLSFTWGGTFTVTIKPTNSGTVAWQTTNPTDGGVFSGSGGHFSFTKNQTDVFLTFFPNVGGSIAKVITAERE